MLFTLSLVLFAFGNMVPSAAGATFRWDTISVTTPGGVLTINPGGSDYALAADLTTIQIRGHGTFGGGVPQLAAASGLQPVPLVRRLAHLQSSGW